LNKSFWLKMIAKLLVIMSLPIAIVTYSSEIGYNWFYSSTLFALQGSTFPVPPPYPGFATPDVGAIVSVLILCSPGIVYNYLLTMWPLKKPIKIPLLVVTVLTLLLALMLVSLLPLAPVDPWLYYPSSLEFVTSWVLVILVLLPSFTREGARLAVDWSRENVSPGMDEETSPKRLPNKGATIGFIMGICSLLLPFSTDHLTLENMGNYMDIRGPFWAGTLGFLSEFDTDFTRFSLYPVPISFDPLALTQFFARLYMFMIPRSVFGILFGYSVLRHLQSKMTEKRILLLAVLSIVGPFSAFVMQPFLLPGYLPQYSRFYIPLPFLQAFGLFIMYRVKPTPLDQRVQDETGSRMESIPEQALVDATPDSEPRVNIPALYRIRSRFQNLRQEEENSDALSNSQPADGD